MARLRLTEVAVRALKPTAKYVSYMDTTTPGFGVRVGLRSKTYIVVRGRDRQRVSLGSVDDLSLSEARAEAKKLLSTAPERRTQRKTFLEARDEFVDVHYVGKAPRTRYLAARALRLHFKDIERKQLIEIEDRHIQRCLDRLADRPSEQLHAFRFLRTFFNWCARAPRRYVAISPLYGYEPPGVDRRGTRILSDAELVAIWNAAALPRYAIFRLMMLWGTRNTETTLLQREWRTDDLLTIPGAHTKNGRDHAIPVCPLADAVLTHAGGNNRHYFVGRWGAEHLSTGALAKLKQDVMTMSGTSDWQIRDLRRTFRSNLARLRVPREISELLINHAPPVLDDIYDRYSYLEEKREALAKYEAALVWLLARV